MIQMNRYNKAESRMCFLTYSHVSEAEGWKEQSIIRKQGLWEMREGTPLYQPSLGIGFLVL